MGSITTANGDVTLEARERTRAQATAYGMLRKPVLSNSSFAPSTRVEVTKCIAEAHVKTLKSQQARALRAIV
eukprot:149611-Alexandrium_andersonii.AAC.1